MKILHVTPLYFPAVGGVENVFRAVSEGLAKRGEDVTVFTTTGRSLEAFMNPAVRPLAAGEETIDGVKVRRFPYRRVSRLAARTFARGWSALDLPSGEALMAWSALPWVPGLSSEIAAHRPDIVLAGHFLTRVVFDACEARKSASFPLVFFPALHLDTGVKVPEVAFTLLKTADAAWVSTSREKEALVKAGMDENKVSDLGVGVYPDAFKKADGKKIREKYGIGGRPVVLFVGRKEKEKGIGTLVQAMEQVWKKYPEARLLLAGASAKYSERRSLDRWIRKYGRSMISIETFRDDEKKDLYDACNLLALPSRIESFGMVYLEAWISGKPVIGADIGSTRSIIDEGEDGYLVKFGDAGTLANKIIHLLDHPNVALEMGARGKKKVLERYDWDRITDKLLDLYRNLKQGLSPS